MRRPRRAETRPSRYRPSGTTPGSPCASATSSTAIRAITPIRPATERVIPRMVEFHRAETSVRRKFLRKTDPTSVRQAAPMRWGGGRNVTALPKELHRPAVRAGCRHPVSLQSAARPHPGHDAYHDRSRQSLAKSQVCRVARKDVRWARVNQPALCGCLWTHSSETGSGRRALSRGGNTPPQTPHHFFVRCGAPGTGDASVR